MKTAKILLSVLLALALTLSVGAPAFADSAELSTTKAFLKYMNTHGDDYDYSFEGEIESSGEEIVYLEYDSDAAGILSMFMFFDPDEDAVCFRAYNLIDFDEDDYKSLLQICNDINYEYKWVTFYVDPSDNSITAEIDTFIHPDSAGPVSFDLLRFFTRVIEAAFPSFEPYAT